jgi:hypothetical protein
MVVDDVEDHAETWGDVTPAGVTGAPSSSGHAGGAPRRARSV